MAVDPMCVRVAGHVFSSPYMTARQRSCTDSTMSAPTFVSIASTR
jgi:hypothetical protein